MTTAQSVMALATSVLVASCAVDGSEQNCNEGRCDDVPQTCKDARYGDGTCNLDLDCAVPDIDCYRVFDSDAAAATWWTGFEKMGGGATHPIIPESDPRFQRVRALL